MRGEKNEKCICFSECPCHTWITSNSHTNTYTPLIHSSPFFHFHHSFFLSLHPASCVNHSRVHLQRANVFHRHTLSHTAHLNIFHSHIIHYVYYETMVKRNNASKTNPTVNHLMSRLKVPFTFASIDMTLSQLLEERQTMNR